VTERGKKASQNLNPGLTAWVNSLNQAFVVEELSISQLRGVITLIPKEDSDLLDLQNWRLITLLNIDYKIASKTLAKRIENVLTKLVHSNQTGFMKGCYIGENIQLICDVTFPNPGV